MCAVHKNTKPRIDRKGAISIERLLEKTYVDLSKIKTLRSDIFKEGYFSVFDVLVNVCKENDIDIKYHFDSELRTYIIDSIEGEKNWWYGAHYNGRVGDVSKAPLEEPVHRMDFFPYKDWMNIEVYPVSEKRIDDIFSAFKAENKRLKSNNGKVIVPEVTLKTPDQDLRFDDIEVKSHGLRNDVFQQNIMTGTDIMLSLVDKGDLNCDLLWRETYGTALIQGYYFVQFNDEKAYGRAGFTYSLGEKRKYTKSRGGRFGNNNIHMTSDIRVIVSPEYMQWRWTDLSRKRARPEELRKRVLEIVEKFRTKGATSPETALTAEELELPPQFKQMMQRRLGQSGVFVEVNGKYYLSEERFKEFQTRPPPPPRG
jgi:hypothetical protein